MEATAVLLGAKLRDLGGKLTHIGAILGPSLAILWVMLKLSRAMVILSGFWRAMLDPLGGSNARIEATVWAHIGAKFGHLGPCKGTWKLQLCFLGQRLGDLEGK